MKKKFIVLMMALMIVGLAVGNASASDWEAIGGLQIVNVTLDTYNDTIDSFNEAVSSLDLTPGEFATKHAGSGSNLTTSEKKSIGVILGADKVTNKEDYDNIDRVPLVYIGAKREINDKWDLNIRYEYIFGEVEQNYSYRGSTHDNSIKVDLHGVTFLLDYEINENWYATGGIGYHQGTKTTELEGPAYELVKILKPTVETGKNEYDLENGISLRGGVGYKRSFAENWDFNAQIDYLYIELDDEQQGNIYSKGLSYGIGLTYNF